MRLLLAPLLVVLAHAFPNRHYKVIADNIDKEQVTAKVTVANTALGECTCDITANACDAYCCCDRDCDDSIR